VGGHYIGLCVGSGLASPVGSEVGARLGSLLGLDVGSGLGSLCGLDVGSFTYCTCTCNVNQLFLESEWALDWAGSGLWACFSGWAGGGL
jgi:hypothetical protein